MLNKLLSPMNLLLEAAAFGLIISTWLGVLLYWSARRKAVSKKIDERLGIAHAERAETPGEGRVLRLWHDGQEATTVVPGQLRRETFLDRLEKLRRNAGWETPLGSLLLGFTLLAVAIFAATYMLGGGVIISLAVVAVYVVVLLLYANHRANRRSAIFDSQLAEALELAARSLRAGHPLVGSFRLISEEVDAPVGPLFGEMCQHQDLGMGLDRAIHQAAATAASPDMKFFATAVSVQLRGGGNVAEMMEGMAHVIRERIRLARRVRVLTAQTQFSKRVLLTLPFIMFVTLNLMAPTYMEPLYTTSSGRTMLYIAATGLFIGALVMNRLVKIRA